MVSALPGTQICSRCGGVLLNRLRLSLNNPPTASRGVATGRPRRRKPLDLGSSTAGHYFAEEPSRASGAPNDVSETGHDPTSWAGQSSLPVSSSSRARSFIFDLPSVDWTGLPRPESMRERRQRLVKDQMREEMTVQEEIERAGWHADPWWRMKKSPIRHCIVTRQSLPSAFLLSFKPATLKDDKDNPVTATDTSSSSSDQRSSTATFPRYALFPHNILHPRFSASRAGKSVWTVARRDVVEKISQPGPHYHHLPRLARKLNIPVSLPDLVEAQLQTRVLQELQLLAERLKGSFHPKPLPNVVETILEGASTSEDDGLETKPNGTDRDSLIPDTSWADELGRDEWILRRLDSTESQAVSDGQADFAPSASGIIDMSGLNAGLVPDPAPTLSNESSDPSDEREGETGESQKVAGHDHALVTFVRGAKCDLPVFHLRHMFASDHHRTLRDLLGTVMAHDLAHHVRNSTSNGTTPPTIPATDGSQARQGESDEQPELYSHSPPRLEGSENSPSRPSAKSDMAVLSSWPAPKSYGGRRGDLGVPLFHALWRLHLWSGGGWEEYVVDSKGRRV